ncbi:ABC transporter [Sulfurifustis variabilis]|uniref:ABC transporter n=1 Tax=Sulfurifustis variabilis TaxID=1675686 RepID=A0A1B4V9D2_9GAMM|nr:ABC transporter ATP-binding protein [Sulfurifustis variabilis]BAU48084.1 ABC transporter [Sulfurifustis variabilis]
MDNKDTAIRAEGVSKVYRIGLRDSAPDSLSGMLVDIVRSPVKNFRKYRSLYRFTSDETAAESGRSDLIWALRDVAFNVRRGEVLGIIGRNGAGKSTLLKILTRITPPTRGLVEIRGRVSSLLEVGTGFHQELTGRENIYLNGTILGMKKREVDRKFDEIVDFSGMERFLDTPVKRYSSGMAVRLAFAVAAHLEPEILIVDEVLAVGDADFQKKCIRKMKEVHTQGRTVLFVSHNMPFISMLCDRVILLQAGTVIADGPPQAVVSAYLHAGIGTPAAREWSDARSAPGADVARLRAVRIVDANRRPVTSADVTEPVGIEMTYEVVQSGRILLPSYWVYDEEGTMVFASLAQDGERFRRPSEKGRYTVTAWVPGNLLTAGTFFVTACLITRSPDSTQFDEQQVIAFNVLDNMGPGTARGDWGGDLPGVVRPLLEWTTEYSAGERSDADVRRALP